MTILVPIDFSMQAEHALKMAADMTKKLSHIRIEVINVVEWPPMAAFKTLGTESDAFVQLQDLVYSRQEMNHKRLGEMLSGPNYSHCKINYISQVGDIEKGILKAARAHNVDLIIMGTKGMGAVEGVFLGSTAEKIVRKASCPVITLQEKVEINKIQNIVFASSLDEDQTGMVTALKKIQRLTNATIHIVKVNTPEGFQTHRQLQELFSQFVAKHDFTDYTTNIYNDKTEEDGVLVFAEELPNSLIAMGTHGRRGIARLLAGSIAENVVNKSHIPVLTMALNNQNRV